MKNSDKLDRVAILSQRLKDWERIVSDMEEKR